MLAYPLTLLTHPLTRLMEGRPVPPFGCGAAARPRTGAEGQPEAEEGGDRRQRFSGWGRCIRCVKRGGAVPAGRRDGIG